MNELAASLDELLSKPIDPKLQSRKPMTPTHCVKIGARSKVTAWQYDRKKNVPLWVFRNFHRLGDGSTLTHRQGHTVKEGDWILVPYSMAMCLVLTDAQFQSCFEEINNESGVPQG